MRGVWLGDSRRVDTGDVVDDALHEDDADMNMAGYVWKKLVEEVVYRIECIASKDTGDGGRSIGMNAGDVKIVDLGRDRISEEGAVVGNRPAVVAARDGSA